MIKVSVLIVLIAFIIFMGSVACIDLASYLFLGTGYDLRLGIPDGPSIYTAEMDPGLKPTRVIMRVVPDEEPSIPNPSYRIPLNSRIIRRYVVDGNTWSTHYSNQIEDKFTFEEKDNFWSSMPHEHLDAFREVEELVAKNKTMITEEFWNVRAEARLLSLLLLSSTNWGDEYKSQSFISSEFKNDMCSAITRSENDAHALPKFFERWGTHVITELTLGYKEVNRYLVQRDDFLKHGFKGVLPVERVDFLNNGGSYTSSITSNISNILENLKRYQVLMDTYKLKFGDETLPLTPLRMQLVPLYKIGGKYLNCVTETVEDTLKKAVKNYLQNK